MVKRRRVTALLLALCLLLAPLYAGAEGTEGSSVIETNECKYDTSTCTLTITGSVWNVNLQFPALAAYYSEVKYVNLSGDSWNLEDAKALSNLENLSSIQINGSTDGEIQSASGRYCVRDGILYYIYQDSSSSDNGKLILAHLPANWHSDETAPVYIIPSDVINWWARAFDSYKGIIQVHLNDALNSQEAEIRAKMAAACGKSETPGEVPLFAYQSVEDVWVSEGTSGAAKLTSTVVNVTERESADAVLSLRVSPTAGASETGNADAALLETIKATWDCQPSAYAEMIYSDEADHGRTAKIWGKAPGTVTVSVTYTSLIDNTVTKQISNICTVTVNKVEVSGVQIYTDPSDVSGSIVSGEPRANQHLSMGSTNTLTLYAKILPDDVTDSTFTWSNSKADVLEMEANDDGSVTLKPLAPGTARITATADNKQFNYVDIEVDSGVTGITIIDAEDAENASPAALETLELTRNQTASPAAETRQQLRAVFASEGNTETSYEGPVTWFSSRPDVAAFVKTAEGGTENLESSLEAKVSDIITVETAGPGVTEIVAQTENGKRYACKLTVFDTPTGVRVNAAAADSLTLAPGGGNTARLTATVLPDTADQRVSWAVTKTEQAASFDAAGEPVWTVTETPAATVGESTGVVTAADSVAHISRATVAVTSLAKDAAGNSVTGITDSCYVFVKNAVTGLSITGGDTALDLSGKAGTSNTAELTAVIAPTDATEQSVVWESLNTGIATVEVNSTDNSKATVTAAAPGTATIRVKALDGGSAATKNITVLPLAQKVFLDHSAITLGHGGTKVLTATVTPQDATYYDIQWSGTDGVTVTPDAADPAKATVTAGNADKDDATVTVTLTPKSGDATPLTAACAVTVQRVAVKQVTLDKPALTIPLGGTGELTATVAPNDATDGAVTWSAEKGADDTDIVTIAEKTQGNDKVYVVTGAAVGTSVVTVKTTDGNYVATCAVTVEPRKITGLELGTSFTPDLASDASLSGTLTATVTASSPGLPSEQTIQWYSSDSDIVSVSPDKTTALEQTGSSAESAASVTLEAKARGTAVIYAVTKDGGFQESVTVTVKDTRVSEVTLDKSTLLLTLPDNDSATLTATPVTPDTPAATPAVTWESSDAGVATVSGGAVTAVGAGTATITAYYSKGVTGKEKSAACTVTVEQRATSVAIEHVSGAAFTTAGTGPKSVILETDNDSELHAVTIKATLNNGVSDSRKGVQWHSSDESIATVTDNGNGTVTVTGVSAGNAAVVVVTDDLGYTDTLDVRVRGATSGILLSKTALKLQKGDTEALVATVSPATADQAVEWSATVADAGEPMGTATDVVSVTQKGVVTAANPGTAKVWAKTKVGNLTASCTVTVVEAAGNLTLDPTGAITLNIGGTQQIDAKESDTVKNSAVTWTSTNESVATVSGGLVTAVAAGAATIVATALDGRLVGSVPVAVKADVESVSIHTDTEVTQAGSAKTLSLLPGAAHRMTAAVTLSGNSPAATDTGMKWTSSDDTIATVDESTGVVTAAASWKSGSAVITVTSKVGAKTDTCTVTLVKEPVKRLALNLTSKEFTSKGDTSTLTATVYPTGATVQTVNWTTSDADVASLSATTGGTVTVTAGNPGTAIITAKSTERDGTIDIYAVCSITVKPVPVTSIAIQGGTDGSLPLGLKDGETKSAELTAVVSPAAASDTAVHWVSSNPAVADFTKVQGDDTKIFETVSDNTSKVTVNAKDEGSAVIYATTADGGLTAQCIVTVRTAVAGVTLQKSEVTLDVGETDVLAARVTPATADATDVEWSVTDASAEIPGSDTENDVVSVVSGANGTATITAKAAGTAKVWVKTTDGGEKSSCTVTVRKNVESVSITIPSSLPSGVENRTANGRKALEATASDQRIPLTAALTPSDATEQSVAWSSSNEAVATVDQDGTVTVLAAGETVIAVISKDGGKADTVTLTVHGAVGASSLTLSPAALTLGLDGVGSTATLTAALESGVSSKLSWKSSDPEIVEVSSGSGEANITENGKIVGYTTASPVTGTATRTINAKAAGTATITVTAGDCSKTCTVTVNAKAVTGVTLNPSEKQSVNVGKTVTLSATVSPNDAPEQTVTWTSSDELVATVDNGVVTGVKAGTAVITASVDGHSAAVPVTVASNVASVEIRKANGTTAPTAEDLTLLTGGSVSLQAVVSPKEGATDYNENVVWRTSSAAVATVSPAASVSGGAVSVTANGPGTAVIIAASEDDGTILDSCAVTVWNAPTGIVLSNDTLTLGVGNTWALGATATGPSPNPKITWSSSNESIVSVDDKGLVKVLPAAAGNSGDVTATITAKTVNGITAACAVTVERYVLSDSIPIPTVTIERSGGTATVRMVASGNNQLRYYQGSSETPAVESSGIASVPVTSETVFKICAINSDSGLRSGTITITAKPGSSGETYKAASNSLDVSSTGNGNTISTPEQAINEGSVSAAVSVTGVVNTSKAMVYMSIYDTSGAMIGLSRKDNVDVSDGKVSVEQFAIPAGIDAASVGSIKFIILGVDSDGQGQVLAVSKTLTQNGG